MTTHLGTFLENSSIAPLVRGYVGECYSDPRFHSALSSLNQEVREGHERCSAYPSHAFLAGEFGLTGICMAYALTVIGWIAKYQHLSSLPPLMPRAPSEQIRHVEKLLVLAVFQSIGKGVDPSEIRRSKENSALIDRISRNYLSLQAPLTGAYPRALFPGPDFSTAAPMSEQLVTFEKQSKRGEENSHYIFIMNNKEASIYDWHVIYANPQLGIIADAAWGLLWKVDATAQRYFHQLFADFCDGQSYSSQEATLVHVEHRPATGCRVPLLLSRLSRRGQTACAVVRKAGLVAGCKYMGAIHRNNSLVTRYFPNFKNLSDELRRSLSRKWYEDNLKVLLTFIRSRPAILSLSDSEFENLLQLPVQRVHGQLEENPSKTEEILADLEEIHRLGPRAHTLSSYLQRRLLGDLYTARKYHYPPHILKRVIPALLKLREQAFGKPYSLDRLMQFPHPCKQQLPYYQLLLDAGANINGEMAFFKYGNSPLCQALKDSPVDPEVVAFFRSRGALEPPTAVKGLLSSL